MNDTLQQAFEFFKHKHGSQQYGPHDPYWPHILRVGLLLNTALTIHKETTEKNIIDLTIAGFGHDSIEDTHISMQELATLYGERVTKLIQNMTQTGDVAAYVQTVCHADEETRLIKLADLLDNYTRIAHTATATEFLEKNVLTKMEPMYAAITTTNFTAYQNTAQHLLTQLRFARQLAHDVLERRKYYEQPHP